MIKTIPLLVTLLTCAASQAASVIYRFDGVVSGSLFDDSRIFESQHGVIMGVTTVTYFFEVDFDRDAGQFTTPVQTVEYFYSELKGDGLAESFMGSTYDQDAVQGANIDFSDFHDTGKLTGGKVVTIHTNDTRTSLWRVEDWQVGQSFLFTDVTRPVGSVTSIGLHGNVTLTSIEPVPEPACATLAGLAGLLALRRRR
ncbi:hypothetical protein OKA04_08235 [Luteolibacter flavescens]|uniref:PEP-CTERM protein-sorting domain-containing protein n=1 Tax=Luteolibacter flavescens TaxID=1859460 RepID=A0ABT3FMC7_9BACT|nr:hypothetical protein [Luteolibacter flavescens]MCW1884713.1 hypothetical protein [Luteolibacter flavescens]